MELVDKSTKRMRSRVLGLTLVTLLALFGASCGSSDEAVIETASESNETPTASAEASVDDASTTDTATNADHKMSAAQNQPISTHVSGTPDRPQNSTRTPTTIT